LLLGYEIELKNRYLRIGQEYGTKTAEAVTGLHRSDVGIMSLDVGINDVIKRSDDVINDVIKFNATEEVAIKAFLHDSRLSAGRLADIIGVKQRQAQRIIDSLKKKAGLKRRGARKNGEWYFEK
jgi:predicted HTH transcriptional regulator